jgi:hypothetical protein
MSETIDQLVPDPQHPITLEGAMQTPNLPFDELVPDAQARREFGDVTPMTFWRWDKTPGRAPPGWEPPIKIGLRKYRRRGMLEGVKRNLFELALAQHAGKAT